MNPPSALYGAMNKERKPFTYTPGGLDLSEIKSERMAKRLMRNAMSEGVSETPVKTIQSPPVAPGMIPNFNCLPVQVFPSFQLPANPKSLLRTRSNTDAPKEPLSNNTPATSIVSNQSNDSWKEINKPSSQYSNNNISSNYVPASIYDYKPTTDKYVTESKYGSYGHTDLLLPEKSYDATYFQLEPQRATKEINGKNTAVEQNIQQFKKPDVYSDVFLKNAVDNEMNPVHINSTPLQDIAPNNFEQKEVKIVKKQTKTENETDQNGDTEAEVVVKLPTKTSAAKTETKVEVSQKILPDGTIEEVKKTITKTTIDGKTEIATKTETRTIPKESAEEVEEIEEEEEEEETENVVEENEDGGVEESNKNLESKVNESLENGEEVEEQIDEEVVNDTTKTEVKQNGHIITGEEKSETSTTKKVVVIQSTGEESEEEVEEEVGEEEEEIETEDVVVEEVVILKKPSNKENESEKENEHVEDSVATSKEVEVEEEDKEIEQEDEVQEEDEEEKEQVEEEVEESKPTQETENEEKQASDEEEQDNKETVEEKEIETTTRDDVPIEQSEEEEVEENYEQAEDSKIEEQEKPAKEVEIEVSIESKVEEENKKEDHTSSKLESVTIPTERSEEKDKQEINIEILKTTSHSEPKVSFREPSIPLEKVEDIEIKPIGPAQEIIKKSHTEIITTTTDKPSGALSTQTEYNRIENFVTVNRTTKTLDHAYEQSHQSIPTLKTYFSPINDRVLSTPQPVTKPYQPVYTPEPQTERRHSLLLDRLSVDRQIPTSDIYQNNYQSNQVYEQNQWSEEPQSEVLEVSNVKPSTITKNQQWYQQSKKENYVSNTISPAPVPPSQIWNQQNQAQPQHQLPTQPQYQTFSQQAYTPKPEYQSTYVDNSAQNIYKSNTNNLQQNTYPSYTPKPSWVSSTFDSKPVSNVPNQYTSLKSESTESYQKSTQQYNSSYVPPPWEQDSSYVTDSQSYYQPPPTVSYTPTTNQSWKPPPSKFSKPAPTAYIPPAPNQSFVKPVAPEDTSKISGRKTYYSEYERRYISVPESTYIPNETKFPAQPDPSPQYYYDNNEPAEFVEPQWRKELREFTEKTQTSTQTEKTSVRPPWEEDPKYAAPTEYSNTVTPSWTQTLRPRSWRERSYEPEYIGSKEWPKTNTLGRGRPQSSYVKSNVNTIPERTRGVSVDRYNPNNYQSPLASEHPPVQSHTLNPTIHPKTYHNPTVPAYHTRASAEPREQVTAYPQQRIRADNRAPPVQSRSFKYLQWITGTED